MGLNRLLYSFSSIARAMADGVAKEDAAVREGVAEAADACAATVAWAVHAVPAGVSGNNAYARACDDTFYKLCPAFYEYGADGAVYGASSGLLYREQ